MKTRFFILTLFVLSGTMAMAQQPQFFGGAFPVYHEDFENGIPADWQVVDNTPPFFNQPPFDAEVTTWEGAATATGEGVANIRGYNLSDFQTAWPNDYLVSNAIKLSYFGGLIQFGGDLNLVVEVGYPADDPNNQFTNELIGVYAYTASDTLSLVDNGFVGTIEVKSSTTPYQEVSLALPDSLAGKTIYLAFRYLANGNPAFFYKPFPDFLGVNYSLVGVEINKVRVTATEIEFCLPKEQNPALVVYPNPVRDHMQFKFDDTPQAKAQFSIDRLEDQMQIKFNPTLRVKARSAKLRLQEQMEMKFDHALKTQSAKVRLYNRYGQQVLQTSYSPAGIDVSHLRPGLYIAKVSFGGQEHTIKMIKK